MSSRAYVKKEKEKKWTQTDLRVFTSAGHILLIILSYLVFFVETWSAAKDIKSHSSSCGLWKGRKCLPVKTLPIFHM